MVVYTAEVPSAISEALVEQGHSVLERQLGAGAAGDFEVSVIVGVLNPREGSERELLQQVARARPRSAVLAVTPSSSSEEVLAAFEAGAHCCVAQGSPQVVAAHATALTALMAATKCTGAANEEVVVGDITIDPQRRQVRVAGEPVPLTRSELEVLLVLLRHAGRVITPAEILLEAGQPAGSDAQARDIVKAHVCRLRQKLGMATDETAPLQTVRGVGYVLDRRAPAASSRSATS